MPKILIIDIETAPIEAYVWGLRDENIGLNQIKTDARILCWAAKWLGDPPPKTMYFEAREPKRERAMLLAMHGLLDEADFVISQNGQHFDGPKLNARFAIHGLKPPSPYRHLDTCRMARKTFGFTSNKLEYLTDKLCAKYKKLAHKKFPGFELWAECLKGNDAAWAEMQRYNIHDVLATEELYTKLQPWDTTTSAAWGQKCACKSEQFKKEGFSYTAAGKYQRYSCVSCGKWSAGRANLLTESERQGLHKSAGGH